jgi:hypothetical protein
LRGKRDREREREKNRNTLIALYIFPHTSGYMQCHNYRSVYSRICYKSHTRLLVTVTITKLKHKVDADN